jgi:nitrite reductase/ring-hydroxylating ferredoxin subunit
MATDEHAPPRITRDADPVTPPNSVATPTLTPTPRPGGKGGLGLRDQIPELGLTEYWYPVIADRKVRSRKGVRRTILGRELVFFRGAKGNAVALSNWCPHRNASLAQGRCIFSGTITCPYHGLTFDENGVAKAFLGEGARSRYIARRGAARTPGLTPPGH